MMVLLFGIALWGLFAGTLGREGGALATSSKVVRVATYNESAWFRSAALTHSKSSAATLCPELPPLLVPHGNARSGSDSSALPQAASSYQKLLWFIALAPPRPGPVRGREKQSVRFVDALKVSVLSARLNAPSLEPHLIYLGQPDAVTGWMESKGVTVHFRVLSSLLLERPQSHSEDVPAQRQLHQLWRVREARDPSCHVGAPWSWAGEAIRL